MSLQLLVVLGRSDFVAVTNSEVAITSVSCLHLSVTVRGCNNRCMKKTAF